MTEPHSGSDALAAKTTARLSADGRHYVLNGQKAWITNGGFADVFTIFAKVDGEKFTAFIVERGMGVVSGADEKKLGLDGSSTTVLMLDNVHVPVENVLGTIGEGHKVAFNILNLGRVKLGTRNISGARQALNQSIAYAKERRQFGKRDLRVRPGQAEAGRDERSAASSARRWSTARSATSIARCEGVDPADGARVLKTIENFAVECSINKVWTQRSARLCGRRGGAGVRRQRLLARVPGRARVSRRAHHPHLRRDQRDQSPHHPDAAAEEHGVLIESGRRPP